MMTEHEIKVEREAAQSAFADVLEAAADKALLELLTEKQSDKTALIEAIQVAFTRVFAFRYPLPEGFNPHTPPWLTAPQTGGVLGGEAADEEQPTLADVLLTPPRGPLLQESTRAASPDVERPARLLEKPRSKPRP